jgi:hypothetical protein
MQQVRHTFQPLQAYQVRNWFSQSLLFQSATCTRYCSARTLMIEAAAMKPAGVPEAVVADALRAAHAAAASIIPPQRRLQAAMVGAPGMRVQLC